MILKWIKRKRQIESYKVTELQKKLLQFKMIGDQNSDMLKENNIIKSMSYEEDKNLACVMNELRVINPEIENMQITDKNYFKNLNFIILKVDAVCGNWTVCWDTKSNKFYYDNGEGEEFNYKEFFPRFAKISDFELIIKKSCGLKELPERLYKDDELTWTQTLKFYFGDEYKWCARKSFWYKYDKGLWKCTNSKDNFELANKITGPLRHLFSIYKDKYSKEFGICKENIEKAGIEIKKGEFVWKGSNSQIIESNLTEELKKNIEIYKKSKEYYDSFASKVKACTGVCKFIPSIINASKMLFYEDLFWELLDSEINPTTICFKNGYIDLDLYLKHGKCFFFPHRSSNYFSMNTNYNLKRPQYCQEGVDFLHENLSKCFDTDEKYKNMLESKAYCLLGYNPSKVAFINLGPGGDNGKGVTADLMKVTLGDYFGTSNPAMLYEKKGDINTESANPGLSGLLKKRYLALPEPDESKKLSESLIKSLIGGDEVTHRGLFQDTQRSVAHFTMHIDSNHWLEQSFAESYVKKIKLICWDVKFQEGIEKETDTLKKASDIKKIVNKNIDNNMSCAWFWILIQSFSDKFSELPEFQKRQQQHQDDNNDVKSYYEEFIEDLGDNHVDEHGIITLIQYDTLFKHASGSIYKDCTKKLKRKKFMQELEKFMDEKRCVKNDTPRKVNGKAMRNYYLGYTLKKEEQDYDPLKHYA